MKTILLLTAIIPTLLFSQSLVFTHDAENVTPFSSSHERLSGGQQIALFHSYDVNYNDVNTVLKINTNGEISNQFSFNLEGGGYNVLGIIPMDNDEFIVGLENYNGNFFLIRFGSDNSIIWKKNYAVSYSSTYYQNQIIQNGTGGIYLMVSNPENLTLLKIDSDGDIEWAKAYIGPDSYGKSPGFSICQTPDNGVIATLKDGSNQCVLKIDALGAVQWSKSFMDGNYRWPTTVRTTSDGNYLVAGRLNGLPYLHKITSSGEFLFAKTFGEDFFEILDVKQHSNGNIYIIGSGGYYGRLTEIDQNGNHVSTKYLEGISPSYYYSSCPKFANNESDLSFYFNTTDSQLHTRVDFNGDMSTLCKAHDLNQVNLNDDTLITQALVMTEMYVNNTYAIVTNNVTLEILSGYDVTAEDFCSYAVGLEEITQKDTPEIYPNPAVNYININANGGVVSQIELYDLQGKCVQYQTAELNGVTQMDVSTLSSGIYRLVMIIDGKLLNEQVVIQR